MKSLSVILLTALSLQSQAAKTIDLYDVTSFGAIGDAKTLNTIAIQKAIDACHQSGGGRVLIPSGKYLTGTLVLKGGTAIMPFSGRVPRNGFETRERLRSANTRETNTKRRR